MRQDELIPLEEAAEALGCSVCTLRLWRDDGKLVFEERQGGRIFVLAGSLLGLPMRRPFSKTDLSNLRRKRVIGFKSHAEAALWCDAFEAAAIVGTTHKTIKHWYYRGKLRGRRIARSTYFLRSEVAAMKVDPAAREVGRKLHQKRIQKQAEPHQEPAPEQEPETPAT